jgi:hypothetical protein
MVFDIESRSPWLERTRQRKSYPNDHLTRPCFLTDRQDLGHFESVTRRSLEKAEVGQRYMMKFFSAEYMPPLEIAQRPREHNGKGMFSQSQIYDWIGQVKLGRTDLAGIVSPGRAPDESLATGIANRIERDPHLSARKLT